MKVPFFSKKALSSFFLTLLIVPVVFFAIPPKKSEATGIPVVDAVHVSVGTVSAIKSTITAIFGGVSAGANVVKAKTGVAGFLKTYILDTVATAFARAILRKITAQTVNWINTGFKGNPAFVTNPGQFFLDIGDQTASQYFIGANSPLNKLCTGFGPQVRLALVKNYIQEDQFNSQCTFSKIGTSFENFTKDFNNGGWAAWVTMTQENQNNPYGAYIEGAKQLSARVNVQNTKYEKQTEKGSGFLDFEVCPKGKTRGEVAANAGKVSGKYGDACEPESGATCNPGLSCGINFTCVAVVEGTGDGAKIGEQCDEEQRFCQDGLSCGGAGKCIAPPTGGPAPQLSTPGLGLKATDCTVPKTTATPGSVISERLTKSLGSGQVALELTQSINQVVNALMGQMISQTMNSIQGGLRGLVKQQSGQKTNLLQQVQESSTPESFEAEKAAIKAELPAQYQPVLTGGEPTGIYTAPSEDKAREEVTAQRRIYYDQTNAEYPPPPPLEPRPRNPSPGRGGTTF